MLAKLTVPAVPEAGRMGTDARRIPRQEVALEENLTENGLMRIASGTALAMRAGVSRDVMEAHRMLAHPSQDITIKTAEMMGIETTGQWGACETCFQAKAKRHAVPKKTGELASVKGQRLFIDVDGPMKHLSLGGNSYVVISVDDCTRFKVVKFVKKKSNTTAALLSLIAYYIPRRSCRSSAYGRIMEASSRSRSTIGGGGRACNKFVLVLGGNGTKIAPTGDTFDQPPGQMR